APFAATSLLPKSAITKPASNPETSNNIPFAHFMSRLLLVFDKTLLFVPLCDLADNFLYNCLDAGFQIQGVLAGQLFVTNVFQRRERGPRGGQVLDQFVKLAWCLLLKLNSSAICRRVKRSDSRECGALERPRGYPRLP